MKTTQRLEFFFTIFLLILSLLTLAGCTLLSDLFVDEGSEPITRQEAEEILDIGRTATQKYEGLKNQDDPEAAEKTVSWLNKQSPVSNAGVFANGDIWIHYSCGLKGYIITSYTTGFELNSTNRSLKGVSKEYTHSLSSKVLPLNNSPSSKKAIILQPFKDSFGKQGVDDIKSVLENTGYEVNGPIENHKVTLSVMETLRDYGLIWISTHGTSTRSGVTIATGQILTAEAIQLLESQYGEDVFTIIWTLRPYILPHLGITQNFFDNYNYPGSLIIINACESLNNTTLADAFLNSGAETYFGWVGKYPDFLVKQPNIPLFKLMGQGQDVKTAYTTRTAIPYLSNEYSISEIYPITVYKDLDHDEKRWFCYSQEIGICKGDEDDKGANEDYKIEFKYEGNSDFMLNSQVKEGKIAFVSNRDENDEIYVVNLKGMQQTNLTHNSAQDAWLEWSPDGSKIAFSSNRDGDWEIYLMNANGTGVKQLTHTDQVTLDGTTITSVPDLYPTWSPDGSQIAFASGRDANYEIYVMNVDGSNLTRLTNNAAKDGYPRWSPDGSKISFMSNRDGNNEIYVMNVDGTDPVNITNSPADERVSDWSPDGSKIVFDSNRSGEYEVYLVNPDGTGLVKLTESKEGNCNPAWSPDGTKIVYACGRSYEGTANWEICIMNSNGSEVTRITHNRSKDWLPDWRP